MNYTAKEREIYNQDRQITCERLGITVNQYNWFRRKGQILHTIYENDCNGHWNERLQKEDTIARDTDEREEQVTNDAIASRCKELGLHYFLQTDPRGATIYLSHEPIEHNNYNRSGSHCIY